MFGTRDDEGSDYQRASAKVTPTAAITRTPVIRTDSVAASCWASQVAPPTGSDTAPRTDAERGRIGSKDRSAEKSGPPQTGAGCWRCAPGSETASLSTKD